MDDALGKRDLDPLLVVTILQALHELVHDQVAIGELLHPQDDREIDRGVAEGVVTDEGIERAIGERRHADQEPRRNRDQRSQQEAEQDAAD